MYEITELELAQQNVELLPAREALALANFNAIVAANTAVALNAGTVNSYAGAGAGQFIYVSQS